MKTYEYMCTVCGEKKEWPADKKPPTCCRKIMRKVFTPPHVVYRGSGWTRRKR